MDRSFVKKVLSILLPIFLITISCPVSVPSTFAKIIPLQNNMTIAIETALCSKDIELMNLLLERSVKQLVNLYQTKRITEIDIEYCMQHFRDVAIKEKKLDEFIKFEARRMFGLYYKEAEIEKISFFEYGSPRKRYIKIVTDRGTYILGMRNYKEEIKNLKAIAEKRKKSCLEIIEMQDMKEAGNKIAGKEMLGISMGEIEKIFEKNGKKGTGWSERNKFCKIYILYLIEIEDFEKAAHAFDTAELYSLYNKVTAEIFEIWNKEKDGWKKIRRYLRLFEATTEGKGGFIYLGDAMAGFFGVDEGTESKRTEANIDILKRLWDLSEDRQKEIILNFAKNLRNATYLASGAQRFTPLALAVVNILKGENNILSNPDNVLDEDSRARLYNHLISVSEGLNIPKFKGHFPKPEREKLRWLDIASGPKKFPPTLD